MDQYRFVQAIEGAVRFCFGLRGRRRKKSKSDESTQVQWVRIACVTNVAKTDLSS